MIFNERYWDKPDITNVGRLPERAYYIPYESLSSAKRNIREESLYFQTLDGLWDFRHFDSV